VCVCDTQNTSVRLILGVLPSAEHQSINQFIIDFISVVYQRIIIRFNSKGRL
jgi:hypothetical protein